MKMVILINNHNEHGLEIAQAWQRAGASGVTILPIYGLYTLQEQMTKGEIELPRMVVSMAAALAHVMSEVEEHGYLFFSVVDDDLVEPLIAEATAILGDLTAAHNGIMFVLPIERAIGIVSYQKPKAES
jgi:hypothetical protein